MKYRYQMQWKISKTFVHIVVVPNHNINAICLLAFKIHTISNNNGSMWFGRCYFHGQQNMYMQLFYVVID